MKDQKVDVSHDTKEGWCCACDYDIEVIKTNFIAKSELEDLEIEHQKEMVMAIDGYKREVREKIEKMYMKGNFDSRTVEIVEAGYKLALQDLLKELGLETK